MAFLLVTVSIGEPFAGLRPCATFLERQRQPELPLTCHGGFLVDAKSDCGHVICKTSAPPARLLDGEKISELTGNLGIIEPSIL